MVRAISILLLSALAAFGQAFTFGDVSFLAKSSVSVPAGTNGVLWWTNESGVGTSIVDPVDVDLTGELAYSIAARACTNLEAFKEGAVGITNFIFNDLTALTNISMAQCDLPLAQSKALWKLMVDNSASNSSVNIRQAIPDADAITNVVILSDRGNAVNFNQLSIPVWFAPINTTYTFDGSSKFVGQAYTNLNSENIMSIVRGTDVHRFIQPIGAMISLTNADFNGDGFDQGTIDAILSDMVNAPVPANGFLDLRNMVPPTDGFSNADYQSLTNNGWTVELTP